MQQMYVYESDGQKFELAIVCMVKEGKSTIIVYDGVSKYVFSGAYMQEYSVMSNCKVGRRQKVSFHGVKEDKS